MTGLSVRCVGHLIVASHPPHMLVPAGAQVDQAACAHGVEIHFQPLNARIRLAGHHHELRKVYQQQGVPPWLRGHVPVLYVKDQLIAIPGLVIADGWQARSGCAGWTIDWTGWALSGIHRPALNAPIIAR